MAAHHLAWEMDKSKKESYDDADDDDDDEEPEQSLISCSTSRKMNKTNISQRKRIESEIF